MISHKHKCIYIHIPKTAGTSIEYKFGHFKELKRGVQDHRTIGEMEPVPFGAPVATTVDVRTLATIPLKDLASDRLGEFIGRALLETFKITKLLLDLFDAALLLPTFFQFFGKVV